MKKVEAAIAGAVAQVASDPSTKLSAIDAKPVADAIAEKIGPAILSATNNEGWYRSPIVWSMVIGLASTVIQPFTGQLFDDAKTGEIANALAAAGTLGSFAAGLYFRLRTKVSLGRSGGDKTRSR